MKRLLSLLALFALTFHLLSAPVPRPRKESCPLVGNWAYHWGGAKGSVEFHADGSYRCVFASTAWVGSYGYKNGLLHIFERQDGEGYQGEWGLTVIHLDKKLKGRATSDVGRAILGDGIPVEFSKK